MAGSQGLLGDRIHAGQLVLGTMILEMNTPGIAAIGQAGGLDFLIYDMEHSGFGWDSLRTVLSTCRGLEVRPVVRVPAARPDYISRALDVGATGVMVPFVESTEQAKRIAQSAKYPPLGRRGVAAGVAHDDFLPSDTAAMTRASNDRTLLFAQIESRQGVENVDAIARLPGLDVIFVGHYDLSCSLGVPGDLNSPTLQAAVKRIVLAARNADKAAGRVVFSLAQVDEAVADGFTVIVYKSDVDVLRSGYAEAAAYIRRHSSPT